MRSTERVRKTTGKKTKSFVFHFFALVLIVCVLLLLQSGCNQPGETMAEGHRRHLRNVRINQQELMQDIDTVILIDRPSKLTDRQIR